MNPTRRQFLRQFAASSTSVSASQFLAHFLTAGLPATTARAEAMAADKSDEAGLPRFLVYWFVEGGWMGYDMFNPVVSPNHVLQRLEDPSLERYRILRWGEEDRGIKVRGNIRYGYLAEDGADLFPKMSVLSSMHTGSFHSGERLKAHLGEYSYRIGDERQDDERTVMQAFAEARGQSFILPHLSWHWWLADGELNEVQYSGRRGYYHALGPSHAHTIYAGTPERLREFMKRLRGMSADPVNRQVRKFLDEMDDRLLDDDSSEVVRAYRSARSIYTSMSERGLELDGGMLDGFFRDAELRERFKVGPADEVVTYRSINGNKARTKYTPATNVQAMMAYELMRSGLSCALWIESRGIRDFDDHFSRRGLWKADGTPVGMPDTTARMKQDLWDPLKTFVSLLESTQYKDTGKSLYDLTTIVLTSEFGRSMHGDVAAIRAMSIPEPEKKKMIDDQDICQHWMVTSCAFLGGSVRGDAQFGRIGEETLMAIPILPDGSLDPAFDPLSGKLLEGRRQSEGAFIPNHGDVYATALHLAGVDPKGRGRNTRPPMTFVGRA